MNELIGHEAVCRTAPAAPGLLNIREEGNSSVQLELYANHL